MRVDILMDRSVEMIAAALEVLKAGGVYVPLDPDHPFERLRYIIDDAVVGAVVTHKDLHSNLSELFPGLDRHCCSRVLSDPYSCSEAPH